MADADDKEYVSGDHVDDDNDSDSRMAIGQQ